MTPSQVIGALVGGRYRVVRALGEGGMGEVYVAVQEVLGREVALKLIRSDLAQSAKALQRFTLEATTLSQLSHPNIVTIFEFGVDDGVRFLAMELLRGESLRHRLNRYGALPAAMSAGVARDIASGLAHAHAKGVAHRDLKPDNVQIVDAEGRGEHAKILDFGVAKLVAHARKETITQSNFVVGTPGYMAPELALHGTTDDVRSDLYALGVIFFEMLAGRPLFEASTALALVMKHATEAPPSVRDSSPGEIPFALERLVMELLEKDPARRPQTAVDVIARIDALPALVSAPLGRPRRDGTPWGSADHNLATMSTLGALKDLDAPRTRVESVPSNDALAGAPTVVPERTLQTRPSMRRRRLGVAGLAAGALLAVGLGAAVAIKSARNATARDVPPISAPVATTTTTTRDVEPVTGPPAVTTTTAARDVAPVRAPPMMTPSAHGPVPPAAQPVRKAHAPAAPQESPAAVAAVDAGPATSSKKKPDLDP